MESFAYDAYDRVFSSQGSWGSGSYSYDDDNNITRMRSGSQVINYTYDPVTNLLTNTTALTNDSYDYDYNGNVIQKGNDHYLYNAANELTQFLVPSMNYESLDVKNGEDAIATFIKINKEDLSDDEIQNMRNSLLKYCEQDTFAMVELHKALLEIIKEY